MSDRMSSLMRQKNIRLRAGTPLHEALLKTGCFATNSHIRRIIRQGSVLVNGQKVFDPDSELREGVLNYVVFGRRSNPIVVVATVGAKEGGTNE